MQQRPPRFDVAEALRDLAEKRRHLAAAGVRLFTLAARLGIRDADEEQRGEREDVGRCVEGTMPWIFAIGSSAAARGIGDTIITAA